MKRRFGVHLSVADGLRFAAVAARGMDIEAVQIMLGDGQSWAPYKFSAESINEYRKLMYGVATYVHLPYTINPCLGSHHDNFKVQRAIYRKFLELSHAIGSTAVVIHPGSKKELGPEAAQKNLIEFFQYGADDLNGMKCLIETDSGSKNGSKIGDTDFIADAVDKLGRDRFGMVIDTEHLFARGLDLFDAPTRTEFLYNYGSYVELVHLNAPDPGVELGSFVDRHQSPLTEYPRMSEAFIKDLLVYPAVVERRSLVISEQDVAFVSSLVPATTPGIPAVVTQDEEDTNGAPNG